MQRRQDEFKENQAAPKKQVSTFPFMQSSLYTSNNWFPKNQMSSITLKWEGPDK